MYLILLNGTLKMDKKVKFMLCIFTTNLKKIDLLK